MQRSLAAAAKRPAQQQACRSRRGVIDRGGRVSQPKTNAADCRTQRANSRNLKQSRKAAVKDQADKDRGVEHPVMIYLGIVWLACTAIFLELADRAPVID